MNMKKCISLFLCIIFILLLSANNTVIADEYSQNFISESIVEKLFDKRSQLILEHKYDELEKIDKELEKFGIKRVEIAEVHEKIKELDEIPYVDIPHSSKVHWFSERRNVRRNGKKYEIQTLFAQPLDASSSLFNAKKTLYYREYSKLNATVNALGIYAFDLTGAKLVKDSYNLISLIRNIMDIKPYEELGDVAHTYDLSNSTTANFKFVKEYGQPDSRQRLGFISTKCFVRVDYEFKFFVFRNGKHDERKIVQKYQKTVKPKLYDNDWAAIDHYLRPSSTPTTDFVRYIEFRGIRNRYLGTIYPVTPAGIVHIY